MSFSFSVQATPLAELAQAIDDATPVGLSEATVESVAAAKAAVLGLVDSGVLGSGEVYVSVSGHANPEHKPTPGWANDFVSLTITQATPKPTPTEDD